MWIFMAVLAAFFAGLTAVLAKIGMRHVDSDVATALRTVVILFLAWGIVYITGAASEIDGVNSLNNIGKLNLPALLFLVLSGIATGLSWLCYFKALAVGNVNKVAAIDKLSMVLTVLAAVCLFDETSFLAVKIAGSVLISGGLWLMIEKQYAADDKVEKDKPWLGYAVLSAVFAAMTAILGKYGITDIDANLGTAIRVAVILIIAWLIVIGRGKLGEFRRIKAKECVFIVLSAFTTGLSWLCYYYALQKGSVSIVAAIDKLSIVVSAAFSWLIFKEHLTYRAFGGLSLIVLGTLVMTIWH